MRRIIGILALFVLLGCSIDEQVLSEQIDIIAVTDTAVCSTGGIEIVTWVDLNDNGKMDQDEITDSEVLCNGRDGADGEDGEDGTDGADGTDGTNGTDGECTCDCDHVVKVSLNKNCVESVGYVFYTYCVDDDGELIEPAKHIFEVCL